MSDLTLAERYYVWRKPINYHIVMAAEATAGALAFSADHAVIGSILLSAALVKLCADPICWIDGVTARVRGANALEARKVHRKRRHVEIVPEGSNVVVIVHEAPGPVSRLWPLVGTASGANKTTRRFSADEESEAARDYLDSLKENAPASVGATAEARAVARSLQESIKR